MSAITHFAGDASAPLIVDQLPAVQVKFEDVTLNVRLHPESVWLLSNAQVAKGFEVSESTLRSTKQRTPTLREGRHWVFASQSETQIRGRQSSVFWTQRGVVRLGFHLTSPRAQQFSEWAEDLIIERLTGVNPDATAMVAEGLAGIRQALLEAEEAQARRHAKLVGAEWGAAKRAAEQVVEAIESVATARHNVVRPDQPKYQGFPPVSAACPPAPAGSTKPRRLGFAPDGVEIWATPGKTAEGTVYGGVKKEFTHRSSPVPYGMSWRTITLPEALRLFITPM